MANKMLIVHGYSDGSDEFHRAARLLHRDGHVPDEKSSSSTTRAWTTRQRSEDFADKLDDDYERLFGSANERMDVACHSTGALVVRAWLARCAAGRGAGPITSEVSRGPPAVFAPANFGSDLAALGQSFLGKFRTTFFNSILAGGRLPRVRRARPAGTRAGEPVPVGALVLGPSWRAAYFNPDGRPTSAAIPSSSPLAKATRASKPTAASTREAGTDGTVRIPGTSLNTRGALDFREAGPKRVVVGRDQAQADPLRRLCRIQSRQHRRPNQPRFTDPDGPGTLAIEA